MARIARGALSARATEAPVAVDTSRCREKAIAPHPTEHGLLLRRGDPSSWAAQAERPGLRLRRVVRARGAARRAMKTGRYLHARQKETEARRQLKFSCALMRLLVRPRSRVRRKRHWRFLLYRRAR